MGVTTFFDIVRLCLPTWLRGSFFDDAILDMSSMRVDFESRRPLFAKV